jgi:DNA-binding NarL/FixJ family response regulator
LIRQGLRRAFERDGDFEVLGEAASVTDGLRLLRLLTPQVVIFDVRLPDGSGIDAARTIRAEQPDLGIVVLTMYAGDEQLFEALEAGASAFVPKNSPSEDVVSAARHAAASPRA